MSKINDLINKLCPNGAPYIKINDCCNFQNGFAFKSNLIFFFLLNMKNKYFFAK